MLLTEENLKSFTLSLGEEHHDTPDEDEHTEEEEDVAAIRELVSAHPIKAVCCSPAAMSALLHSISRGITLDV